MNKYTKYEVIGVNLNDSVLDIRKVGGRMWELISPFTFYIIFKNGTGLKITAPKGFKTNLTSFPLFGVTGDYDKAAVCHDYLYTIQVLTQHQSDKVFLLAMKQCKVNWFVRRVFYSTVWLFGFRNWSKAKKLLKQRKD